MLGKWSGKTKFSIEIFQSKHRDLSRVEEITNENSPQVVELLRTIGEGLIWSEQNHHTFFQYFRVNAMESLLIKILFLQNNREVSIQLIQTANMLIHNLSQIESLIFLLKTQFYAEIVSYPFDFTDDEIIENYLSLLKGIAINLDPVLLQIFIIEKEFRLYTGALMFLNYKEAMIRTGARTVILTILKLEDPRISEYIIESGFFNCLVSSIREEWIGLNGRINSKIDFEGATNIITDNLDNLLYVNDIFEIGREEFNKELADYFMKIAMFPVIVGGIGAIERKEYQTSIPVSLFLASQIMKIIKYSIVQNCLAYILFSENLESSVLNLALNPEPLVEIQRRKNEQKEERYWYFINSLSYLQITSNSLPNPIRSDLYAFLRSKDSTLITLSLLLIYSLLSNKWVAKEFLLANGLLTEKSEEEPISAEQNSNTNISSQIYNLFEKCRSDYSPAFLDQAITDAIKNLLYKEQEETWKVNETYEMGDRMCERCIMKRGNSMGVKYFVEDPKYFILVEPDPMKINFAKVELMIHLKYVDAEISNSDKKSLILGLRKQIGMDMIVLDFDDQNTARWIKNHIDDQRNSVIYYEATLIENLLDQ
ncbi:CLEC16A_1 [Blepharisma stoltei]|uniref:FPL domain-containing protein n=1 Tax=Blepharisma stoltei TaxID=1481888 RepID=A0AAU9IG92_9CILI|nr:unnamed protein product [Blepharisma stoltei]